MTKIDPRIPGPARVRSGARTCWPDIRRTRESILRTCRKCAIGSGPTCRTRMRRAHEHTIGNGKIEEQGADTGEFWRVSASIQVYASTCRAVPLGLDGLGARRDPRNQIDRWDGREYRRVLLVKGVPVETVVTQVAPAERPELLVAASPAKRVPRLRKGIAEALDAMLGLSLDLSEFYRFAARQRRLGRLALRFRGLKPPRFPTVWDALVNAISCQQLSLTVGIILMNRLAARFGVSFSSGLRAFPRPTDLARAQPFGLEEHGLQPPQG